MNKEFFSLKLSEIADVVAGQSPESIYYSKIEGVPFLQGNRTFGALYPSIDTFTSKVTKLAKKDEVLISVRAPVGDLNFAPCDLCIGRGLASIKAKNGNNKFIYYALKYNVNNLLKQGSGTTFDSVNKDVINDLELIVPEDTTDRDKVAQVLSALDSKIELNNRINAELEAMAKTIYDYWFVQFEFPISAEQAASMGKPQLNGKPYKTSGGKMVWNEELKREIPEGWEVKELGSKIQIFDSLRIPLSSRERSNRKGEYPYFGATSIMDYIDDFIFDDEYILVAEDGSVMDAKGFPIVQFIWGKTWVNNHAHVIQATKKSQNEFYYQLMKMIPVVLIKTGSIQMKINQENLKKHRMLIPNEDLIESYSKKSNTVRRNLINNIEQNQKLTELRDWLLPMLMNGQVKCLNDDFCD